MAAGSGRLEPAAGDGWLAVGDAASTFDPLSGQGILKGLRGGTCAAYAISDHLRGDAQALAKYRAYVEREFESYLDTRADFYALERRWPESPFWRRPQPPIELAPTEVLARGDAPAAAAHELVSELKRRRGAAAGDRRIILALQDLVAAGVLRSAEQAERR